MKALSAFRPHAGRVAALVAAAVVCGQLSGFLQVRLAAAALVLLLFTSSMLILGAWVLAAAVVFPLAVMTPWARSQGAAHNMVVFALAASMLWVAWLLFERSGGAGRSKRAAAIITAVSCVLSPPLVPLAGLIALYYLARPAARGRLRASLAVFLAAPAVVVICFATWDLLIGGLPADRFFARFSPVANTLWSVPRWSLAVHGKPYNHVTIAFNRWFYWPVLVALAALSWSKRRRWWFAPTYLWGAVLFAGSLAFGAGAHFQYSVPMQVGLVVPLGLAGGAELCEAFDVENRRLVRIVRSLRVKLFDADTREHSLEKEAEMKKALVTGITGQDGSYLADFLLEKGYEVHGMVRRSSTETFERIAHIKDKIHLHQADLLDQLSLVTLIREVRPAELYNLAAMSFVPTSWVQPVLTAEFTGLGVTRVLEAVRLVDPEIRFYQASSSEMFGRVREVPQNEDTPFHPRSPYGVAKVYGHWITVNYRESYGLYACSGILFNHESPRRGKEFVTRKITDSVARIKLGLDRELRLGNLDPQRDWGFAGDYVAAMWLMLQRDEPRDYVVGSEKAHSVRDFAAKAFAAAGLDWEKHVVVDEKFFRPAEVDHLIADTSRARGELGWSPQVDFDRLVAMMVEADIDRYKSKV